jgi:hypothetical protein
MGEKRWQLVERVRGAPRGNVTRAWTRVVGLTFPSCSLTDGASPPQLQRRGD